MKVVSLLIGLVLTCSAWAEIGSVTEFSGTAVIKRGNTNLSVAKGTLIETNDRVETKNGRVKITFKDNTTVSVTESSSLVIDDFVYDPKSSSGKLSLKAASGTVRYVSGNIAHNNPNSVKINTPTAAIAVRGTDFVMAVAETGSSMVMLMPSCEIEQNVNLRGLTCGSGAIDVETPSGIVKMNKPYQATLVETAANPPSPPVTVNLNGTAIGNNLLISPPKTPGGMNVIVAARAAAEKTGDSKRKDDAKKEDVPEAESQQVASKQESRSKKSGGGSGAEEEAATKVGVEQVNKDAVASEVAAVGDTDNPYVKKLFKDKSETQQIGWMYESLSPNNKNYANIILSMDTKVLVTVTQDMQTNQYNFSGGRAQGQIVINQNFR